MTCGNSPICFLNFSSLLRSVARAWRLGGERSVPGWKLTCAGPTERHFLPSLASHMRRSAAFSTLEHFPIHPQRCGQQTGTASSPRVPLLGPPAITNNNGKRESSYAHTHTHRLGQFNIPNRSLLRLLLPACSSHHNASLHVPCLWYSGVYHSSLHFLGIHAHFPYHPPPSMFFYLFIPPPPLLHRVFPLASLFIFASSSPPPPHPSVKNIFLFFFCLVHHFGFFCRNSPTCTDPGAIAVLKQVSQLPPPRCDHLSYSSSRTILPISARQ